MLIEFQYKYAKKHKILWIKSLRRILYFLFKPQKKIQSIYEMNKKTQVIMISLIFHHCLKIKSVTWRKITRSPQVLRKHITWRNFLKESLARNKVFLIPWQKVCEKIYWIMSSLIFDQHFEWENGTKNSRPFWRCSFCYTGFTEWYVLLTLGRPEGLPRPKLFWNVGREKDYFN